MDRNGQSLSFQSTLQAEAYHGSKYEALVFLLQENQNVCEQQRQRIWSRRTRRLLVCSLLCSCGTNDLTHTFKASRGSLPVDQAFVLQIPVFAVQVLFAKHLAVLQLG